MTRAKTKTLPPSSEIADAFTYDPITGILYWRVSKKTQITKVKEVGTLQGGYLRVHWKQKMWMVHRLIWKMEKGTDPQEIDHINRNKLDNRIDNLRAGNRRINNANKGLRKTNTSGIVGVSKTKGYKKWVCRTSRNGKGVHLGVFNCPALAGMVYMRANNNKCAEYKESK